MGRPSRLVLEQPDRADVTVPAQVEPVPGAARHTYEVTRFDLDRDDGAAPFARVNVKQAAATDDESDLVLVVPMLRAELGEHRVEIGRRGRDVDDVRRDVSAAGLQLVDFRRVRRQYGLRRRVRRG